MDQPSEAGVGGPALRSRRRWNRFQKRDIQAEILVLKQYFGLPGGPLLDPTQALKFVYVSLELAWTW